MKTPGPLTTITLLPPPEEAHKPDATLIEDWARGLEWVKWLLGSVRARAEGLMLRVQQQRPLLFAWDEFSTSVLSTSVGPALKEAWESAAAGDLAALLAVDEALTHRLPPELARRSAQAGAVLLKSTQHARYQAILGRYREAVSSGRSPGHLPVVWATVGHFFQLSLTNVIAEYLHLEWDVAVREANRSLPKPQGRLSITALTGQVMRGSSAEPALRVVDA